MKRLRKIARRFLDIRGFRRDSTRFAKFLRTIPAAKEIASNGRRVGIVVGPWHYTATPWFGIALAYLYRFRGFEPWLIWDDVPYADATRMQDQNRVIGRVLAKVSRDIAVLKLSEQPDATTDSTDLAEIQRLSRIYAIARFRSSFPNAQWAPYIEKRQLTLLPNLKKIRTLLSRHKFDHLVLHGGIYGNTSLFLWEAKRIGLRVTTHDAGFGLLLTGVDGIAAHQKDVAKIFRSDLWKNNAAAREKVIKLGHKELEARMFCKETTGGTETLSSPQQSLQKAPYKGHSELGAYDVLMPLNVDYDMSALGVQRFFGNPYEWMVETIDFLLKNTQATIAVREHPVERNPFYKARHDLKSEFQRLFNGNSRLRLFTADEDVNTYNLIESARVVLPLVSTTGTEAAAMGRHVVMESDAYYSELSFVQKATSKQDYFQKIVICLQKNEPLAQEKIDEAYFCYFSAQVANRIFSHFTPQPTDFDRWVSDDFSALLVDETVQSLLKTLGDGVPAVVWRFEQILKSLRMDR